MQTTILLIGLLIVFIVVFEAIWGVEPPDAPLGTPWWKDPLVPKKKILSKVVIKNGCEYHRTVWYLPRNDMYIQIDERMS